MESLKSLYEAGFIVEEEYQRRKAQLLSQIATDGSLDGNAMASSFGVPLETYGYLNEMGSSASRASGSEVTSKYVLGGVEYLEKPSEAHVASIVEKNRQSRSLRLFISSTFKDMTKERELLVKTVFPQIRRLCASRLVNFVYIDFRWGITSEESAGGKVLDLCLNEIDKCRPYFLGILGQRYGWSQQSSSINDRNLAATFDDALEKHPWIDSYRDRSVTELEMLHGALFHPNLAPNALFYLRNESYLDSLDSILRRDFEAQSHGERDRLEDLRARIVASTLPCSSYNTPEAFATRVLDDLTAIIDRDFPVSEASLLDEWDLQRQAQWNSAAAHFDCYVARNAYDSQLARIANEVSTPLLVLHGSVGCGKTAIVSTWAMKARAAAEQDSRAPWVVFRMIGQFSIKLHKIILSILVELKRKFNIEKPIPSGKEEIVHALAEWLLLASLKSPIVLVLDGVDKLESTAQSLSWIPLALPPGVTLIVTCPDDSKPLNALLIREAKNSAFLLPIGELKESERREMANKFLSLFSKKLAHEQLYLLTSTKNSANALFLRSVLELLRSFGDYDRLTEYLTNLMRAHTLDELLMRSIDQWEIDFATPEYPNFIKDLFGCLYASRGGLLESELSSLLRVSQQSTWSSLLDATSFVLRNQAGLLYFANEHIKTAIRTKFFQGAEETEIEPYLRSYRELIAAFFETKDLSPRKIYDYPFQIVKLGKAASVLPAFLSDLKVFKALYTDANKLDLFGYWQAVGTSVNVGDLYKQSFGSVSNSLKVTERGELLAQLGQFLHEYGKASEAGHFYEQALAVFEPSYGAKSLKVAELLHKYAMLLETLGLYAKAFEMATRSHGIFLTIVGASNPKTAASVWLQGVLKKKMNEYDKAIELFKAALEVAEQYYGADHPTTALYLRTLADVYRNQALYDQAHDLYRRSLAINRATFGECHPEVAEVLSNLGRIEKKRGNYDAARPLYEQAMSILIQLFGAQHMVVAEVYVQMGDVLRKIGEDSRALELYKRALSIYVPELGPEHPDVGEVHYLMGLTYKQTGNYEESIQCSEKAIQIAEKAFGLDHLKVASPVGSLADVYSITARYSEAVTLYLRALKIHETKLGKDHPECSENLNALGMISKKRGRYQEAREYYLRSLEIVEKVFGPNHPKVAMYVHNLGVIYRKLKQHSSSMEAFQRAKKINVDTFGEEHPLVAGNMVGIALAIVKSGGNLDEARDLLLKTVAIFTDKLGDSHEKVALSLNYLAEVYRKQGLFGRGFAETTYERALKINQHAYGEWNDHPELAENMNGLAQVYKAQLNYTKAEPMFLKAIAMSERTLGLNHPHVINRYRNLALMYEAQGSVPKAQEIFQKIEQLKAMPPLEGE
jgi:tetratricopeptide (TPR) repeat protein